MSACSSTPRSSSPALPDCADFLAHWNHKDTRHATIEHLAQLLAEARVDIDDDDCLRYADVPGRNARASRDDARRKDRSPTTSEPITVVSSATEIRLDPDKAQAARAALRAHRSPHGG
ncbi:MAG: hypothetical protein QM766_18125 [Burkholderiaceae bacterium]